MAMKISNNKTSGVANIPILLIIQSHMLLRRVATIYHGEKVRYPLDSGKQLTPGLSHILTVGWARLGPSENKIPAIVQIAQFLDVHILASRRHGT